MYSQNKDASSTIIQTEGELFEAVQSAVVFEDGKTFSDSYPITDPEQILERYQVEKQQPDFDLRRFISQNFILEGHFLGMNAHIRSMWAQLYKPARKAPQHSTLIPLPHPYIVPGGRFQEIYYWDSYFTCLGLAVSGHIDWIESMVANFAYFIDEYGYIPNGNRAYFLSRSQPPFFCCMLQLLEEQGISAISQYLPQLQAEYRFWMSGQRAIKLDSGVLNRYWDEANTVRTEAYRKDMETYRNAAPERQADLHRNIRAACESGWDFSSRWLIGSDPTMIRAIEIAPVDLNCLLYDIERQLAEHSTAFSERELYRNAAEARKSAIQDLFWDEAKGWFCDYLWTESERSYVLSLAGLFPLYFNLAEDHQAERIARRVERDFIKPGGVVTTLIQTGQQWDFPNGWAPLQWIAVQGLLNYGYEALARSIAERFVALACRVYGETGKMMEKYDVCDVTKPAGGGAYPVQDGFGWTNGVIEALIHRFELYRRWG